MTVGTCALICLMLSSGPAGTATPGETPAATSIQEAPVAVLPSRPYPTFDSADRALTWLLTSKLTVIEAMIAARARHDGTDVARLLLTLEDLRAHVLSEVQRFLARLDQPPR